MLMKDVLEAKEMERYRGELRLVVLAPDSVETGNGSRTEKA